jgi:hypothetical protein
VRASGRDRYERGHADGVEKYCRNVI